MPWLFSGDAGDLVIRGLDILGRLSYREISKFRHVFIFSVERKETHASSRTSQRLAPTLIPQ